MEETREVVTVQELLDRQTADKQKRTDRCKKMLLGMIFSLVIISVILWIYIFFGINGIADKINAL